MTAKQKTHHKQSPLSKLFRSWLPKGWDYYATESSKWEEKYKSGYWDYLDNLNELAHYSIIIGYLRHLKPGGRFLDLGCGTGVLQQRLGAENYARFVGVDFAEEAIKRANTLADDKTAFFCADINVYRPEEKFDAIIFNEVLYYLDDPIATLDYYQQFLADNGLFLISMYCQKKTQRSWDYLESRYKFADASSVTNIKGQTWISKIWFANAT